MAIISANLQFNRGGHGLLDYSSFQTNYSTALTWAQDVNSNAAVGQFIYLAEAETIEGVEYAKGPYVVDAIGEGAVLTPLSKSVAGNPDLASLVSNLQGEVGTLKTGLATTNSSVKTLETTVAAIPTTYATKAEVEEAIGDIDFSTLATKEEVSIGLAAKADSSTVYTKDVADGKYVAKEGYVAYTEEEKEKLASLANIKSVGDNLSVDENGKLEVSIPEVEVPFQSVAEGDKLLTLSEGVLKSDVSFGLVEGKIQLTGKNNEVIGEVDTADFVVDGVLDTVAWSEEDGKENILVLTWNTDSGKTAIEIDFGKYVDAYAAGEGITLTDKTFAVDYSKVEKAGAAAAALADAKLYIDGSVDTLNAAIEAKVDKTTYNEKVADIDSSIEDIKTSLGDVYTKTEIDSSINEVLKPLATIESVNRGLSLKADVSTTYTKTEVDDLVANYATTSSVDTSLAGKVDKVEGSSLVRDELITKLGNLATINSVEGDLTLTNGVLSVDLSGYVSKEEGKGLSTNDFTNDFKTKLEGVEAGAQVNYVKSVGNNLSVSDAGELTVDLSAYAKGEELSNGLATKLDASVKVNGVSFANGEATLDAGDIALETAITRTGKDGEVENVYGTETSIQSVLANLSQRIDVLDPNVTGELGITSIVEGNGVKVVTSGGQATISVKASEVEGNMAEVKTDGVYVADMRSYWEAI